MGKVSQQEGDLLGHAGSNAGTHSDNLLELLLHAEVQGIGGIITETLIHLQCTAPDSVECIWIFRPPK